jgi:hypothetical protein
MSFTWSRSFCLGALLLIHSESGFSQGFWVGRTADRRLSLSSADGQTTLRDAPGEGNFSGAATDGSRLWITIGRDLQERTLDGRMVRSFMMREEFTDLAWDTKRRKLWAVFPDSQNLVQIEPSTGRIEMEVGFSSVDPGQVLKFIRAIGLAYDAKRDRLYVSFCETDNLPRRRNLSCLPAGKREAGLIQSFDPEARSCQTAQTLFRTKGYSMGLAYDAKSESVYVVSTRSTGAGYAIARYSVGGTYAGEVAPYPTGYSLGLEYVEALPKASGK